MCSYCDRDDGHTREHCPERLEDKYGSGVDLRDGETRDDDSHADVVAAQLAEADAETLEEIDPLETDDKQPVDHAGTPVPPEYDGVDLKHDGCPVCGGSTFREERAGYYDCDGCRNVWAGDPENASIAHYVGEPDGDKKLVTDGGLPDDQQCQDCEDAPATEIVQVTIGGVPAGPLYVCAGCAPDDAGDDREIRTDGGQSPNGSERFEYECIYTGGDTYQNILDELADEGWRFVESIEEDEIFVFERRVSPQDTETSEDTQ